MPLIADREHSTISRRRIQPSWIVLAVVAVLGLGIVSRLVPDPATVDRVTIRNDTEFDLDVAASASDHDGWTPIGIALAGSERSFEQVIDHGDEWVFRFHGQGRAGAAFFLSLANTPGKKPVSWDEHSLDAQRFYNISCWLYGASPFRYVNLVAQGLLPAERAARCGDELNDLRRGWKQIAEPKLKRPFRNPAPR